MQLQEKVVTLMEEFDMLNNRLDGGKSREEQLRTQRDELMWDIQKLENDFDDAERYQIHLNRMYDEKLHAIKVLKEYHANFRAEVAAFQKNFSCLNVEGYDIENIVNYEKEIKEWKEKIREKEKELKKLLRKSSSLEAKFLRLQLKLVENKRKRESTLLCIGELQHELKVFSSSGDQQKRIEDLKRELKQKHRKLSQVSLQLPDIRLQAERLRQSESINGKRPTSKASQSTIMSFNFQAYDTLTLPDTVPETISMITALSDVNKSGFLLPLDVLKMQHIDLSNENMRLQKQLKELNVQIERITKNSELYQKQQSISNHFGAKT